MTDDNPTMRPDDIVLSRKNVGMTQKDFADAIGIPVRTLQGWEQGRRNPSRTAQVLLNIISKHPAKVIDILKNV